MILARLVRPLRIAVPAAALMLAVTSAAFATTPFVKESVTTVNSPVAVVSIAIAPNGEPAMLCRVSGTLQYKRKVRGNWIQETVDSGSFVGYDPSLAFNAAGVAYAAYSDGVNSQIKMAVRQANGTWAPEVVATGLPSVRWIRLALDGSSNPRIAFVDAWTHNLKYVAKSGGVWGAAETIPKGAATLSDGTRIDLALESNGTPHISFAFSSSNSYVVHAWKTTSWSTETVSGGFTGRFATSIAITSTGTLKIAYDDNASQYGERLMVATKTTGWSPEAVAGYEFPHMLELGLDTNNAPLIAYQYNDGFNTPKLRFATKSGGSWTTEDIEAAAVPIGYDIAMAVDGVNPVVGYTYDQGSSPTAKIADAGIRLFEPRGGEYYNGSYGIYLRWGGSGSITVESSDDNGINWHYDATLTAVQANNAYQLPPSYYVSARCLLRITRTTPYARQASEAFFRVSQGVNRPWAFGVVDANGRTGYRPSIATDGTLTAISYYDSTNADLRFASRCLDGPWAVETIASAGDVGFYSSTRVVNGTPYVLFMDTGAGILKLATKQYGSWSIENVFTGSVYSPSLAVSPTGAPHVAFWTANEFRYGYKSAGTWTFEKVDDASLSGECSIGLTSTGSPRIAYSSQWWSVQNPRYGIRLGANNWVHETTEPTNNVMGFGISLAINAQDLARITYVDQYFLSNKRVRIAYKTQSGWTASSIRSTADDMGYFTSIALNASDQPFVTYWSHGMFQVYGPGTSGSMGYSDLGSTPMGFGRASVAVNPSGDPMIAYYDMANGDLDALTDTPDRAPPAAVTTTASLARYGSVVSWYDVGDDGMTCSASYYEVREYFSPINSELAWANGSVIASGTPGLPWTSHCVEVATSACSPYWFATRMRDNANQWSPLGNTAGGTTPCTGYSIPVCDEYALHKQDGEPGPAIPAVLEFGMPTPNPVVEGTTIRLGIPDSRAGQQVEVAIFDVAGRRVTTLIHGALPAGWHTIRWNRSGSTGHTVERGMYYLRMSVGGDTKVRSMLVLGR